MYVKKSILRNNILSDILDNSVDHKDISHIFLDKTRSRITFDILKSKKFKQLKTAKRICDEMNDFIHDRITLPCDRIRSIYLPGELRHNGHLFFVYDIKLTKEYKFTPVDMTLEWNEKIDEKLTELEKKFNKKKALLIKKKII